MSNSSKLISDEELLRVARECRSNSAFNELLRRYTYYAKALSSKYSDTFLATGIRKEEIEEVAIISFYSAYKKARTDTRGFYLYWIKAAERDIRNYYKQNSYLEGGRAFAGPSLDDTRCNQTDSLLSDYVGTEDERMKREMLINDLMIAINNKDTQLTRTEKQVLKLFLKDLSFKDIGEKMNMSSSTIYNIFYKATAKLRKVLKND